jgi:hypothetical protein
MNGLCNFTEFDAPKLFGVCSILNREKKPIRTFKRQAVSPRSPLSRTDEKTLPELPISKFPALARMCSLSV